MSVPHNYEPLQPLPQRPMMMQGNTPGGLQQTPGTQGNAPSGQQQAPGTQGNTPTPSGPQQTPGIQGKRQFQDPKLTAHSQGMPTTYGKNHAEKFGKHVEQMRRLTGAEIGKKVKTDPQTQQQIKNVIDDIVATGEARTRPWGIYKDAIWSRKGDAVVIRQSNGEFVTFLDGTQGGNVDKWN